MGSSSWSTLPRRGPGCPCCGRPRGALDRSGKRREPLRPAQPSWEALGRAGLSRGPQALERGAQRAHGPSAEGPAGPAQRARGPAESHVASSAAATASPFRLAAAGALHAPYMMRCSEGAIVTRWHVVASLGGVRPDHSKLSKTADKKMPRLSNYQDLHGG